ncbi:COX15/CtaA family protein [Tessaracoccus palaemonis]|uniref:COX15/CtaA family protein n=1 Tax=Tessaracoccus palaemonis TaxID=2829499 RepID=A0ABX8SKY3_9ACTN|nr:COX15/CtaA family protein [Tessaracoccus palaemonis]QXT64027.1 COX15/CtaA family protein [Tessaracoccus palaemonis]
MNDSRLTKLSAWAMGLVFVTILLGSMVCATDSSSTCPAWPACYPDQIAPQLQVGWLENPVIEFVHRAIAFAGLVLTGLTGWFGRRHPDGRVRVLPWVALGCAVGSAVFGMMIILFTLPLLLGLLDLGLALVALLLTTTTYLALRRGEMLADAVPTRRLAGGTFALLVVMHLLGSVVAGTTSTGTGSFTRCLSWPLWTIVEIDGSPVLQGLRMAMAVVAAGLIIALADRARRADAGGLALALVVSLLVELGLGMVILNAGVTAGQTNGIQATIAVLYSAVAVVIMWCVAFAFARAMPRPSGESSAASAGAGTRR